MNSGHYNTLIGRFDVFLPFIEKGVCTFTNKGGNFGMIVPRAFLRINYAEKLRKFTLKNATYNSVVDFGDILVFDEAAITTCIPIISKKMPNKDNLVSAFIGAKDSGINYLGKIPQEVFLLLAGYAIRLNITPNIIQLKESIDCKSILMRDICYCITGLVGHDSKTGASVDRLIHSSPVNETCKPYIEAKEWDGRYSVLTPKRYIEYKPEMMHRPKFPELFESPKILIQRLTSGDYIKATIDINKVYVNHVLNCCTKLENVIDLGSRLNADSKNLHPDPNYNLEYVLSLVSSRLLGFYHNQFLSPALDIFPETIRNLPIRRISFTTPADRRTSLIIEAKEMYQSFTQNTDMQPILAFVDARLAAQPEESDIVHDLLAFLAEQMMEMNKTKNAEIKAFLNFVESEIGASINTLSNKTLIQEYYESYFTNFVDVLVKNKSKIKAGYNPKSPTNRKNLEAWYIDSCGKLNPLIAKTKATDALIDQIVYKLYGLTKEEIAIVEGREN